MNAKNNEVLKQINVIFFTISILATIYNILFIVTLRILTTYSIFTTSVTLFLSIIFYTAMLKPVNFVKYIQVFSVLFCIGTSLFLGAPKITAFAFIIIFFVLTNEYAMLNKKYTKTITATVFILCIVLSSVLHKQAITSLFSFFFLISLVLLLLKKIWDEQFNFYVRYMKNNNKIIEKALAENRKLIRKVNHQTKLMYNEEIKAGEKDVRPAVPVS